MGKFVSEAFKEVHAATWKDEHGTKGSRDIIQILSAELATPARWQKAVQHLKEEDKIENSPKDIGLLIQETQKDISKECGDLIKEQLFAWAWPQLKRTCTHGLPEWYKEELMKLQFTQDK